MMTLCLLLAAGQVPGGGEDPARANWDDLMKDLRPGGAFEDPHRPEGKAFARVRKMGTSALPFLIRYIDHEDLPLGRAAVAVLNALSGRSSPLPNEGNKDALRREWEAWLAKATAVPSVADDELLLLLCPLTAAEVRALVGRLSAERPGDRAEALARLQGAVLEHEDLIRDAYLDSRDPDSTAALRNLLGTVDGKRRRVLERLKDSRWLLRCLARVETEAPEDLELGARTRRLLVALERCRDGLQSVVARRQRIERECSLRDLPAAHWARAHESWRTFQREPGLSEEARREVDADIAALNARSLKSVDELRRRAVSELEAGRRLEGIRLLEEARPRFDGTDGGIQLERMLDLLRP